MKTLHINPVEAKKTESGLKDLMKRILDTLLTFDKPLEITFATRKNKRSLDQNAYCFVLCQKIAEVIGSTKELVYQKFIKDVGQFAIVPIKDDAVESYIRLWGGKGLGWHAEVLDDSKFRGYKNIITYFGSSSYNTAEMCILLNETVLQAKELGIETLSENELLRLKNNYVKG